ncbi:protein mono-ADP-ribosyltransferase PARP14-like isoform X4 [Mytilus californianus]|uniref:protein mono-ADP-ribosyltransferase PARP14-like isoform X3 n=1 Tax=Mytilus californianus TaxID=6549 RepID=UPI002245DB71|nr:protein mono-ADP-ribosyltransferase PARP14-like isoform X3 [Mytilus californianus]XP_052088529.1 protein mono-ADP-ribosyltransferase PARP14-like isoform X4 [Mytilus californianus]
MSNAELRQKICEKCILVKGFNRETAFNDIRQIFTNAWRGTRATRTANYDFKHQEWIVQFFSTEDAQKYTRKIKVIEHSPEEILYISACELPCDIPDEWLQTPDCESSYPITGPPNHHGPFTELQHPPSYSLIYPNQGLPTNPSNQGPGTDPSAPPLQQPTGPQGFSPYSPQYDPRYMQQHGHNPQNPHQQHLYPHGMLWNQYPPGTPYTGCSSPNQEKGPLQPQQQRQWGSHPYQGYDMYNSPYGPYQGQGHPYGLDPHQQVQQFGPHGNPSFNPEQTEKDELTQAQSSSPNAEYLEEEISVQQEEKDENSEQEKPEEKLKKTTTNMLKVTKLPPNTTAEFLENFFENTRKFGGGDVDNVEYDEDTASAIITFEEDEAVEIVLKKIPILFNKKAIEVSAHIVNEEEPMEITEEYESNLSTSEPAPTCTIEVRGMTDRTTQDTIMYYFESKKGANADVENIEYIEDKDMYLVTFEDEEAVNRVLGKSNVVDGTKLQVKKHIPPKRYPNKALVKGFNPKTTKDGIINFLEARTKLDVEEVDFGDEDSGKAIVTFCEPIDIGDIQTACKKKALDGSYLTVHPVVVTNCIVVRGFSEKTTESGLEYYFDNKRKSGVEGVANVKMDKDEDYCVIYFENAEDALLACKKSHTIDNCTLNVKVFYDCLGVPADTEGPKFKPLPPLVITDIDKYKINFLKHSTTKRDAIEKQVVQNHAKITWPSSIRNSKIVIESTLTKETEDCRKLAKSWEDDIKRHLSTHVDALITEKHSTLQEAWSGVMQKLREIIISDPEDVSVSVEKPPACEIIVVGLKKAVKEVSDIIKQIINEVSEDLDREKKLVTEKVPLKHHQLLYLDFSKFIDNIRQNFNKMEISIDTREGVIIFHGLSGNVNNAKISMFEQVQSLVSVDVGKKSPGYIKFLNRKDVKTFVGKEIKSQGFIGIWDIQKNTITMYAVSDEEAVAATVVLKDSVIETEIPLETPQRPLLRTHKWSQHVQAINEEYQRKPVIIEIITDSNQGEIIVYCTSRGEAGLLREKIQDFFYHNTETQIRIDFPPAQLKFLNDHMSSEVSRLESDLKRRHVIVTVKSDDVLVKGNAQGIQEAKDEVKALVSKILKTKHSIHQPGLQDLVNSSQGKSKLTQVSRRAGVVISSNEDEMSYGKHIGSKSTGLDERAVYTAAGGQEVIVIKGDITGLDVDVIVNGANKDLNHSGGLAKALVQKGGYSIQEECNKFFKYKGALSEGECYCSKPGTLKCQMIVHAVGPSWQGGSNREEDLLQKCVERAIVETEKKKYTTIAIPALCTGIFGYPAHQATRAIVQAVRDYFKRSKTCKTSIVETVYLCDVNESSVDLFVKAGDKLFNQRTDGGRTPSGGGNRHSGKGSDPSGSIPKGNIRIRIEKGELAKMETDAIVNTTSADLNLSAGLVSQSLLRAGGSGLQDECKQKYPKGINSGEVAVTKGGKLKCKIVLHGCLEPWRPDGSTIKVLETFVNGCLTMADSKHCSSVAFPALGTGNLGYPKDLVAKHMISCVENFSGQNPKSSIKEVKFVLYFKDDEVVKAFEDEERRRQGHDRQDSRHQQPEGFHHRNKAGNQKPKKEPIQPSQKHAVDANTMYSVDIGNLVLKIYQGDITAVKVDVIVNGTNIDLDLTKGAVANAIRNKGGKELEGQLKSQRKAMGKDGIAVTTNTSSKSLPCGAVIHIDMTDLNPSGHAAPNPVTLKDKVKKALKKTEELKKAIVAFPALGTSNSNVTVKDITYSGTSNSNVTVKDITYSGTSNSNVTVKGITYSGTSNSNVTVKDITYSGTSNSNVTVKEAAEQMFKAVEKFNSKPINHVKEVHVVIYQQKMMTDFMAAIKECVDHSTSNNKGYVGKFLNWVSGGYISGEKEIKVSTEERLSSAQALGQRHSAAQALVDRKIDDKVTFVIYSKDQRAADGAIKLLETAIVEDHIEKSVPAKIIKEFTNDQIAEVKKLEQTDKVTVNVDKFNEKITIKGMTKFVATAMDKINDIIRKAELGKQNIQKATLVKDIAQWYFMDDDNGKTELKEYPDDVTVLLETALMKQEPQAFFLDSDGNKYIVDFDSYEEYPAADPTDTVKVLRKSKLVDKTFEPPSTWTHMDEKENLKVVPLVSTDQEYKDVVKKFTDTARGVNVEFVKIERVQNKTLYQQYIAKKKSVDATNKPGNQNERFLWHGFSKDAMDSINRYGFNRSYCGKNLTAYGLGVYFAVESAYSVQDTYSVPDKDANKHKRMYLCRVLVGEYAVGNKDTKVPPPKAAGSHILYDTVTNNVANPAMFIIFHDSQAFPEYLVTFKRL